MPRPVTLKVQRLPHGAGLPLPLRMTAQSAGMDLPAAIEGSVDLAPGEIRLIPCGFAMALPAGFEAQVRPRSGLATRHGITLVNSPGTIDADYRGEVCVALINLGRQRFAIARGDRIAQMVVAAVPAVRVLQTDRLPASDRGAGGFGHTGTAAPRRRAPKPASTRPRKTD